MVIITLAVGVGKHVVEREISRSAVRRLREQRWIRTAPIK